MAEGLFHFAGLHELAKRVRPSRRPGRRRAEVGAAPDAEGAAPRPATGETEDLRRPRPVTAFPVRLEPGVAEAR